MTSIPGRPYKRSRHDSLDSFVPHPHNLLDMDTNMPNEVEVEGYTVPSFLQPGLKTRVLGGVTGAIWSFPRPHLATSVSSASLSPNVIPRPSDSEFSPNTSEKNGTAVPITPPIPLSLTPTRAPFRPVSAPTTTLPCSRLQLDTRLPASTSPLGTPTWGTPTSDESEQTIGVNVVRAVQAYFKHLLALLREDGAFDDLRPWILRAPMCAFSPDLPAHLRPNVLELAEALVTTANPEILESEGYLALIAPPSQGGGEEKGCLEALILSDLPALMVSAAVPSLSKVSLCTVAGADCRLSSCSMSSASGGP